MAERKIKRSEFRTFIDTTPSSTPTWELMGNGIVAGEIAYNPQTWDETYIHQDSGTTEVESYKPSMDVEAIAINEDPVFEFLDAMRKARAVMEDAHTDIVNVWMYEDPALGEYEAEFQPVTITFGNFGGDGGASNKISFTVAYRGDATLGTFNPSTLVFTPNP